MPGSWVYKDDTWSRMFSSCWAMEVTATSSGVRGELKFYNIKVLHVEAHSVTECKEKLEKCTRAYLRALVVNFDIVSWSKKGGRCVKDSDCGSGLRSVRV